MAANPINMGQPRSQLVRSRSARHPHPAQYMMSFAAACMELAPVSYETAAVNALFHHQSQVAVVVAVPWRHCLLLKSTPYNVATHSCFAPCCSHPLPLQNQVLMLDALPGAACPLVAQMSSACTQELGPYHPVISHWPAFAPHLETAMCRVVRCTQAALTRLCQMARGNAVSELPGNNNSNGSNISNMGGPGNNGGPSGNPGMHQRSGSLMPGGPGSMGANNSSNHNRSGSLVPPSMRGAAGNRPETGMPGMGPLTSRSPVDRTGRGAYPPPLNSPGRGPAPAPRMSVLLKEAVLLNSLKHLMVLVPSMEATLQQCCATVPPGMAPSVGSSAATTPPLAPPGVRVGAGSMVDDMTLGAQFAQVRAGNMFWWASGVQMD